MGTLHRPIRTLLAGVLLAGAAGLSGCADVKESLTDASREINSYLGIGGDEATAAGAASAESGPASEAEESYRAGLAAREGGDLTVAFGHFQAAAEQGHAAAAYELAEAYRSGRGTAPDAEAAARWTNLAAERGDPRARYRVGAAYYHGLGVEQDYEVAARFLGQAAVEGHAQAQFLLAECFANGRGVAKNAAWAARWYGKAALQGHREAQYAYGLLHAAGVGLPKDPEAGHGWLLVAEGNGHEGAPEIRRSLAEEMGPEAIARSQAWAEAFRPDPSAGGLSDRPTVRYVQYTLNELGFDAGPVDGLFGPRTRAAIEAYRTKRGQPADGRLNAGLLDSLLESQATGRTVADGG